MEDEKEGRRLIATADALSAEGRYEDALGFYGRAIACSPSSLGAYRFVVGELLFELQRYDDAARAFDDVVRAMPTHAQGWEALGRTLTLLGMTQRATAALEQAIALAPGWGDPLYHAALAYAELGQRTTAEDRLRRAIALDPRFAQAARDDGLG